MLSYQMPYIGCGLVRCCDRQEHTLFVVDFQRQSNGLVPIREPTPRNCSCCRSQEWHNQLTRQWTARTAGATHRKSLRLDVEIHMLSSQFRTQDCQKRERLNTD